MNQAEILMAKTLIIYRIHFGHIDPESEEGQVLMDLIKRKVFAVLN